jgi:AraC-like DNA-binding protein
MLTEGHVGGAWIDSLLAAMRHVGLDVDSLMSEFPGWSVQGPNSGRRLEVGYARRLYHRADEIARDPVLGLRLGERIDDGALGFLGVLIWHGATVHQALDDFVTYQWAISENGGLEPHLERHVPSGDSLRVYEYVPARNAIAANRHQMLTVVSSVVDSIRRISRGGVDVAALRIPDSLDAEKIGRHLGCAVERSDANLAIAFREEDLRTPIAHRDPQLYKVVKEYAADLYDRFHRRRGLVEEIKACIRTYGLVSTTLPVVERSIGLHRRLIQRALADAGSSFRELKDEVVREEAVRLLLAGDASVASIATELGYTEPSAFHRAFQKWFGVAPGQFRESEFYSNGA